eukprot:6473925-Amphidinium_carterae.1
MHTSDTTARLIAKLKDDLKNTQRRDPNWYTKKSLDKQFQIHGDPIQRMTNHSTRVGEYMQIKTTYKQTNKTVIANKTEYKRHYYHEYSVITGDKYMDK